MKLNKIEKRAIHDAVKYGFTFAGDSFFSSYHQAKITLNRLVKKGYLEMKKDREYGRIEYIPTNLAKDFIEYGIET